MKRKLVALSGLAVAVASGLVGCSNVLGLKDPTLDDPPVDGKPPDDAAIDMAPPIDMAQAGCDMTACPFGCVPNSPTFECRPAKLWVYATRGQFQGNGFGGEVRPATVRTTSDTRCVETASQDATIMMRGCSPRRTHAVLSVSASDSLGLMATTYSIPTTAPVHRAEDDVLVFNNWNDLVDTSNTKPPRVPVTTLVGTAAIVWSGALGSTNCTSWTTPAASETGVQGDTSRISANWLSRTGAIACDQLAKLLCVCWSGGDEDP